MSDILKEIEFWTLILRDHGEFQYVSLSPSESSTIREVMGFRNLFEKLHDEVVTKDREYSSRELMDLIQRNKSAVMGFIKLKKEMLARLILCDIELSMTPSFLNHMINEAFEYYHVLNIADGRIPFNHTLEMIRLHKVWLPDASGHANAIACELDAIEAKLGEEARKFAKEFDHLFKKAFEMYSMYERTGLCNGELYYFNSQVEKTMDKFIEFLEMIEELREECKIFSTGTFSPLMPNHMLREEKYYLYRVRKLEKK